MVQCWSSCSRLLWFIANCSHGERQKDRELSCIHNEWHLFHRESLLRQWVTFTSDQLVWLRAQVFPSHIMIKYPANLRSGSLATCLFIFLSTLPSDISTIPLEAAFQGRCIRLPGSVPISIWKSLHNTNWYFCHGRRHAMASIIHSNHQTACAYCYLLLLFPWKCFPTPAHYNILLE